MPVPAAPAISPLRVAGRVQSPADGGRRSQTAVWIALALVIAVAAFTRLWRLDLIDFKADEAQIAGLALDVASGRWPAVSIPTSNGVDNPPLPVYILGLAALFSRDPAWQAGIIGLLDVAGVAVTFLIGSRYFGKRAGLAAAAFYAANGYATVFGRKLAGPFLQPLFAALLLWCLLAATGAPDGRHRARPWFLAVILLAMLVELHLGALLLVPVVALLLAVDVEQRGSWRPVLAAGLGALAAGLLLAPYVGYETLHRPDALHLLAGSAGGAGAWTEDALRFVWITLTSPAYGDLTGAAASLFDAESWPAALFTPLTGMAALGGLTSALLRFRDGRFLVLSAFVVLPVAATAHHGPGLEIHYFVFLEPALFLLAGVGFDGLVRAAPTLRLPAFAMLGVLLAIQTINFRHFIEFLQRHSVTDAYGLPLHYQQQVFGQAERLAAGRPVVAGVNGRDQANAAAYFLRNQAHVDVGTSDALLLPAGGGVYVTLSRGTPAAHALEVTQPPAVVEPLPGGAAGAAVYDLDADTPRAVVRSLGLDAGRPARWTNGLRLLGTSSTRALPAELTAAWQATAPLDARVTFFNQVLDDDGRQWFDQDLVPVDFSRWSAGDVLLTFARADLPDAAPRQEYWWWLGMYRDGGERVPLVDNAAQFRAERLKGGHAQGQTPPLRPADATFGGAIRLQGYAIDPDAVTLQWACTAPVGQDYTVFVHALTPQGTLAGQADAQPDHYPTSLWDPGEVVLDRHALHVPPGGQVEVGLYDLASGRRLALPDGSDRVLLSG